MTSERSEAPDRRDGGAAPRATAVVVFGLVVAVSGLLAAGVARLAGATQDDLGELRAELARIFEGSGWRDAEWSVLAVSLDTGDTLFARGAGTRVAPASNMKLLTTAAALHHLGPEYRYRTLVLADGPLTGGTLDGDLILYGTGDPGLSDRFFPSRTTAFEGLADQLLAAGITRVAGDLVGDGSFFAGPLLADGWDPRDLNDWFAAPAAALSFNENVVSLRIEPAATSGASPTIHTLPANADVPVANGAVTGRGRIQIEREHPTRPITVTGGIPRGGREVWRQMTVGDPHGYAARIFRNVLEERGVVVTGAVRTVADPSRSRVTGHRLWAPDLQSAPAPRVVAEHRSPPLSDYLEVVNKLSHNLLAEMTLKTLGRVVAGDGSYAGGARVVRRFLADRVALDTESIRILDGSGLSGLNRVSAADLVSVVAYMAESGPWDAFWATLPEAGNSRELRRMYRTAAAGNLRAKTGTIEDVSALSGLVRTASGERIAFSVIGNRLPSTWTAKGLEDRFAVGIASFERPFEARPVRLAGGGRPDAEETRTASASPPPVVGPAEADAVEGAEAEGDAEPSGVPEPEPSPRTHRVARGENFTVIARRYGISLADILEANPDISPRRLQAGQWVNIPPSSGNR